MNPPKPIDAYSHYRRPRKNFRIQLLELPTAPPKELLVKVQHILLLAVDHIQTNQKHVLSREKLYQHCKMACLNGLLRSLWAAVIVKREKVLSARVAKVEQKLSSSPYQLCQALHSLWLTVCKENVEFQEIFCYLDRTLVTYRKYKDNWDPQYAGFFDLSKKVLLRNLRANMKIMQGVLMGLVALLEEGRGSDPQQSEDTALIKDLVWMFIKLGVYDYFEKTHIFALSEYYKKETKNVILTMNANAYLLHVSNRIEAEIDRTRGLTEKRSIRLVKSTMEEVMIKQHISTILQRGFIPAIEKRNLDALKLMYQMLDRVGCLNELRAVFAKYICDTGGRIVGSDVQDQSVNEDMISNCIVFQTELKNILEFCFASSLDFKEEMRKSWIRFMNQRHSRVTITLLVKFLDGHLSGSAISNQESDEEVDRTLGQAMTLLCFIEDEGLFQVQYRKGLAKRLLEGNAKRTQCEISMITRIREECGQTVAMLLEGMLKDVNLSKELAAEYNSELSKLAGPRTPPADILKPSILTTIMWPIVADRNELKLPVKIEELQKSFEKFYSHRFKGRRLKWNLSRSTAILDARFRGGVIKELKVTAYQALVLLLFDNSSTQVLSLSAIGDALGIPVDELSRNLKPLCYDKILLKYPPSHAIKTEDKFKINEQFTSKHYRVEVTKMIETAKENQATCKAIGKEVEFQIDATLVRLMKIHKQLSHRDLLRETIKLLKFTPSVATLNERIERLIDRDYLSKDETDPQIYYYQA